MIFGKMLYALVKEFRTSIRAHDFDLEHPVVEELYGKKIEKFTCKICKEKISLERWQMKSLPFNMSHGCKGYK